MVTIIVFPFIAAQITQQRNGHTEFLQVEEGACVKKKWKKINYDFNR